MGATISEALENAWRQVCRLSIKDNPDSGPLTISAGRLVSPMLRRGAYGLMRQLSTMSTTPVEDAIRLKARFPLRYNASHCLISHSRLSTL